MKDLNNITTLSSKIEIKTTEPIQMNIRDNSYVDMYNKIKDYLDKNLFFISSDTFGSGDSFEEVMDDDEFTFELVTHVMNNINKNTKANVIEFFDDIEMDKTVSYFKTKNQYNELLFYKLMNFSELENIVVSLPDAIHFARIFTEQQDWNKNEYITLAAMFIYFTKLCKFQLVHLLKEHLNVSEQQLDLFIYDNHETISQTAFASVLYILKDVFNYVGNNNVIDKLETKIVDSLKKMKRLKKRDFANDSYDNITKNKLLQLTNNDNIISKYESFIVNLSKHNIQLPELKFLYPDNLSLIKDLVNDLFDINSEQNKLDEPNI
ncbi:hypothetical protein DEFDS_P200 (plasmid) [Deferribacter desulfuricans SSM1]|uniref:Uncharacterized protein n=1 Tax=Deferribacter desulfuricans (strain DSM 14783 / JCM 11476 / NBRC 101012 / SSM1) TaxID=639282 RepID=D3PF28_DEFDS|nr:hypothetical protein [Deferribacter desulfuricans]BAI81820.1 hypothetical protein DEFDS_P200 [Deferribacter desulfuricans SSM1]